VSAPPFLADENIPAPVVAELRRCGFDVQSVAEDQPGATDSTVAALATATGRVLLSEDHDFGELAVRRQIALPGCVLIELPRFASPRKASHIATILRAQGAAAMGAIMVIEPARVRIRPLPK